MSFNVGNKEVHIQRKKAADSPFLQQLLGLGLALLLVLAVTSIIIATSGKSPLAAFQCMIKGAFGTKNSVAETLIKTVPLLLAGLGLTIFFRVRGAWKDLVVVMLILFAGGILCGLLM